MLWEQEIWDTDFSKTGFPKLCFYAAPLFIFWKVKQREVNIEVMNTKVEVMMKIPFDIFCLCFFCRWRNNLTHLLLSLWIKYVYIKKKKNTLAFCNSRYPVTCVASQILDVKEIPDWTVQGWYISGVTADALRLVHSLKSWISIKKKKIKINTFIYFLSIYRKMLSL